MKKMLSLLISAILLCALMSSCAVKPQTFSWNGLTITLTDAFEEKEITKNSATFTSYRDLYAVEITFEAIEDLELLDYDPQMSLEDYGRLAIEDRELETEVEVKDGVVFFRYTDMADDREYTNIVTIHRQGEAFWLVRFAALSDAYAEAEATFLTWAKTVSYSKPMQETQTA